MTGEQQEAVCELCGHAEARHEAPPKSKYPWCGECWDGANNGNATIYELRAASRHEYAPPPVVPSDDEKIIPIDETPPLGEPDYSVLCTECGAPMALPNGLHHPLRERFAQFHEPCERCRDHYFGMPRLAAPPTPSQDAEGDGWRWGDGKATRLGEAVGIAQWRVSYKPGQRGYDFDTGTAYHNVPVEVESAIREPYEALVKALLTSSIAQSVLTNFKSRGVSGVCDVLERDWGSDESDVAEFCTILARIEESLGGSKDG